MTTCSTAIAGAVVASLSNQAYDSGAVTLPITPTTASLIIAIAGASDPNVPTDADMVATGDYTTLYSANVPSGHPASAVIYRAGVSAGATSATASYTGGYQAETASKWGGIVAAIATAATSPVQSKGAVSPTGSAASVTLDSTPTPGNMLIMAMADRGDVAVPTLIQTGWQLLGTAQTWDVGSGADGMWMWGRCVQPGDGTGPYGASSGGQQFCSVSEWDVTEAPIPAVNPTLTVGGVEIERPSEVRIRAELNGTGSGYFSISRGDVQATEALLVQGAVCSVTFPEIDPDPLFEFFLEDGDFELISGDEEGGEELRFSGPGTLAILRRAILAPESNIPGTTSLKLAKGVWEWDNQEAGAIIQHHIAEAEARGVLSGITRTFSDTVDSDSVAWTPMGHWVAPIGNNVYDEVMRLVDAGQLHIEMTPGLVLHAWESVGTDRSSTTFGSGKVRFVKGVNIADELVRNMAGQQFASVAWVKGTDGSYIETSIGSPPYVAEAYLEVQSKNATILTAAGQKALGYRSDERESLIFAHIVPWPGDGPDEANGIYLPGPDWTDNGKYWLGDLVTAHTGTGEFDYTNATFQVVAITLSVDATGYLAPPIVELGAPYGRTQGVDAPSSSGGTSTGGGSVTSLLGYQRTSEKGVADGYASLDGDGFVPLSELSIALDDLTDVYAPAPADQDVLTWDDYLQAWVAQAGGGGGATFGTPAIVLGTAAAAGSTDEVIRRDATIVAFDATAPVTQDYEDVAAAGSAAVAARRDHVHGMPAAGSGLALSDATPIVESGSGSAGTGTEASRDDHVHPAAGGSGGVDWTLLVDEDGSSFANFTAASGTWGTSGTVITQTDTANAWRRAKYNTLVPIGLPMVFEADLHVVSTTGTDRRVALGITDGTNVAGLAVELLVGIGVRIDRDAVSTVRTITATIAHSTTYKLRLVLSGGIWLSVYLDGTLIGNTNLLFTTGFDADSEYLSLLSYGASVTFDNIKAWVLTGGLPA